MMYLIKSINVNEAENSFIDGEGEILSSYTVNDLTSNRYTDLASAIKDLEDIIGNRKNWVFSYMSEYADAAEIFSSILTNDDGYELTPEEEIQWKNNEIKAYSLTFYVLISKVTEIVPVSKEEFLGFGIKELK